MTASAGDKHPCPPPSTTPLLFLSGKKPTSQRNLRAEFLFVIFSLGIQERTPSRKDADVRNQCVLCFLDNRKQSFLDNSSVPWCFFDSGGFYLPAPFLKLSSFFFHPSASFCQPQASSQPQDVVVVAETNGRRKLETQLETQQLIRESSIHLPPRLCPGYSLALRPPFTGAVPIPKTPSAPARCPAWYQVGQQTHPLAYNLPGCLCPCPSPEPGCHGETPPAHQHQHAALQGRFPSHHLPPHHHRFCSDRACPKPPGLCCLVLLQHHVL